MGRKKNKRLLLIAFYFPPIITGGVFRPLKFVKYLPDFGWRCIVLTVSRMRYVDLDPALMNEIPDYVLVKRVPFFSYYGFKFRIKNMFYRLGKYIRQNTKRDEICLPASGQTYRGLFSYILQKLVGLWKKTEFLLIPDEQILWLPLAFIRAFWLIRREKISTVLTTSPPNSSHLLGFALKKITRVKWVADFRDPWFSHWFNIDRKAFLFKQRLKLERWLEKKVLMLADRVICVSDGDSRKLQNHFLNVRPDKFCVIKNGYDQDDFKRIGVDANINGEFIICHLGYLYKQTADDFFLAVELLLRENEKMRQNMEIRFVGHLYEGYQYIIEKSDFRSNFRLIGQLSHIEALQSIYESDVLLVFLGGNLFDENEIPGKIFEYMASKKPILAIAPKEGDTANILRQSKLGTIIEPGNVNNIKDILMRFYQNKMEQKLGIGMIPNEKFIKQFDRRYLTQKLANLLNGIRN